MPDGGVHIINEAKARAAIAELQQYRLVPARWMKQERFELMTGYTVKAQRCKMDEGVWPEWSATVPTGIWKRAPDFNRLVNIDNYYAWVEGR